jgi:hypothetical protein
MAKKEKSLMRQLIDERGIKDVAGVPGSAGLNAKAICSSVNLLFLISSTFSIFSGYHFL